MSKILHERIVLVTDTGDELGAAAAYEVVANGGSVVANDPVGAGTLRAAADAMVASLKRRDGYAIPSYKNPRKSFRDCIDMIQVGFDRWFWISGIVHVDRDNGKTLQDILRAASHPMKEWGGSLVVLNASPQACAVIAEQAQTCREGRLLINAIPPTKDGALPASLVDYLMSPEAIRDNVYGKTIPSPKDMTPQQIRDNLAAVLAGATEGEE
ncbi:MAG: hypothetical protein AAFV53_24910 [Myxococcota bacterium]